LGHLGRADLKEGDVQMKRSLVRLVAVFTMIAAFAIALDPGAGAQGVTELTVHHRLCGENYTGGSEFDECHDVLVGTAFEFTIEGPVNQTASTDVNTGNVTFTPIPAGTYHLFGGVPGEFSNQTIYCSDQNTGNAVEVTTGEIGVNVEVPEGASVVCDVYEFPEDLRGEPEPTKPATGQGVTRLPDTGAGTPGAGLPAWLLIVPAFAALGFGLVARKQLVRVVR
jgi:hypothetical protein